MGTIVFHNAMKIREIQNAIREIFYVDGTVVAGEDVKQEAGKFFHELLNQTPPDYEGTTKERLEELLKFQCSDADRVCWKERSRRKKFEKLYSR